jgi:hypothetical protein
MPEIMWRGRPRLRRKRWRQRSLASRQHWTRRRPMALTLFACAGHTVQGFPTPRHSKYIRDKVLRCLETFGDQRRYLGQGPSRRQHLRLAAALNPNQDTTAHGRVDAVVRPALPRVSVAAINRLVSPVWRDNRCGSLESIVLSKMGVVCSCSSTFLGTPGWHILAPASHPLPTL